MKKPELIAIFALLFCGLVFIFTIFDFAALHDIKKDYVSQYVLSHIEISLSDELPSWTKTEGEWQIVSFSLYLRLFFLLSNIGLLIYYYRRVTLEFPERKKETRGYTGG